MAEDTETTEPEDTTEEVEPQEGDTDTDDTDEGTFDAEKARAKIRKINSENRNLRKRATDAEAKAKDADNNGERLSALEAENLRLRIGVKHGLPEALVKRLSGTTEEEILQDAEELMELFGSGKKPPTQQPKERLRGGGDPTHAPEDFNEDEFLSKVFRH